MVARVSRKNSGLSQYLITGKRKDSKLSRDQKDKVTSLYGSLDRFAFVERYLVNHKSYKDNYLHLTLGFSKSDMKILESAPDKDDILKNLTRDYIAYYTTGYDLENEVIAYAEAHEPKIEHEPIENDKGEIIGHKLKERLSHIHIAIALHNPVTDKQLRPPFFSIKRDEGFRDQMCEKYGLQKPVRDFQRVRENLSFGGENRAWVIDLFKEKGFKNGDEAISWLKANNKSFKVVKTGKNHYIKVKITDENGKRGFVNLRGRGFEHLELGKSPKISQPPVNTSDDDIPINPDIEALDVNELKKAIRDDALERWRKKRILEIDKARKAHERRKKAQENAEPCAISYQNKVFYNRYKTALKRDLKGYYIDTSKDNQTQFKAQGVDILDTGNKLTAKGTNTSEQVALMLDIAQAKGWSLYKLKVTGSESFKAEVEKQINERIQRIKNEVGLQKIKTIQKTILPQRTPRNRTYTPIDSMMREKKEYAYKMDIIKDFYKTANVDIINTFLLDEQFSKQYLPNLAQPIGKFYEQQEARDFNGDKILDKRTGRSKSIIDFFTKEAKVPMQTALAWLDKQRIEEIERQEKRKEREKERIVKEQESQRAKELENQKPQELIEIEKSNDEILAEIVEKENERVKAEKSAQFDKWFADLKAEEARSRQEMIEKTQIEYEQSLKIQAEQAEQENAQNAEAEPQQSQETTQSVEKQKENKPKIRKKGVKSKSNDYGMGM